MWRDQAACAGTDPDLFFSDTEGNTAMSSLREVAEQTCVVCPVLEECARWADDHRAHGLWGGAYRTARTGRYERRPLIPGAPLHPLGLRAVEASVGMWVA